MVLTITRFEVLAFLLLICKFVQDYSCKLYLDLVKGDIDHKNVPEVLPEEDIDHKNVPKVLPEDLSIMIEKIIINSLLYSSIVSGGFLCRTSLDDSLNKLLALMLLGSCLLVMNCIASCSLLMYHSLGIKDEVLNIFSVIFAF